MRHGSAGHRETIPPKGFEAAREGGSVCREGGQDWPTGGKNLTMIRHLVGVNMTLGVLTIAARYLLG